MKNKSLDEQLPDFPIFPKVEIYFKLRNAEQESSFINAIFDHRIPHASYYGGLYSTSNEGKEKLESLGIDLEIMKVVNIGDLPLEERNEIKEKCRSYLLSKREKARRELKAEYGLQ